MGTHPVEGNDRQLSENRPKVHLEFVINKMRKGKLNLSKSEKRVILARDLGISFDGKPGSFNVITDVAGVRVGHVTLKQGKAINTGVTAVLPHAGNLYQDKVPAGFAVGNGYGKFAGSTQVRELGEIETPIVLTNTLSVAEGMKGVIEYTLTQAGNESVRSVNAIVGEDDLISVTITGGDDLLEQQASRVADWNAQLGS